MFIFGAAAYLVMARPAVAIGDPVMRIEAGSTSLAIRRSDIGAVDFRTDAAGGAWIDIVYRHEAATHIAALTSRRAGEVLTLFVGEEKIASAAIVAPIGGGYIGVAVENEVRAARIVRMLAGG